MKLAYKVIGLLLLGSVLFGCDNNKENLTPKLSKIVINTLDGDKLDLNETTTLTATGYDQFDDVYDISNSLVWSKDSDHINIEQNGTITGISVGTTIVTAEAEGITKTQVITVWDSTAPRIEIYVSDVADYFNLGKPKIIKYNENGENSEVFIDNNLSAPQDILFLEDQEVVLISNATSGRITRYNANTGAYIDNFATNISFPTRMKIGPDGLLYVLQWQGELVLRFELDGTALGAFTSVGVNESIGLDWDTDGNLYVSSYNEGSPGYVRMFDTSGNDLGLFINANLQGPTNIWFDATGNLMVNDWLGGTIQKFSSSGVHISSFITGVSQIEGVDFLDNGDIVVGVGSSSSINQYTSSGSFVKRLVTSGAGDLIKPNAVRIRRVNY